MMEPPVASPCPEPEPPRMGIRLSTLSRRGPTDLMMPEWPPRSGRSRFSVGAAATLATRVATMATMVLAFIFACVGWFVEFFIGVVVCVVFIDKIKNGTMVATMMWLLFKYQQLSMLL